MDYEKIMVWIINGIGWFLLITYTVLFSYMAWLLNQYPEVTLTFPAYYFPLLFISVMYKGMWIMMIINWKQRSKKDESRESNL